MNISSNPSQSFTFASRTTCPDTSGSQRTDQSLQKSMYASTQEKIQNIFSIPSKKIKTLDMLTNATKTRKLNNDNDLQLRWARTTGYNKQFGKSTSDMINSSFALLSA